MPEVAPLLEKLPDLTVVIDHMADCPIDQPAELEKLIALKRYPKVFVKISHTWSISKQPYPWLDAQEYVKRLHAGLRTRAPDVGHRLAHRGRPCPPTSARSRGARRDEVPQCRRQELDLSKTIERVWPFGALMNANATCTY